MKKRLINLFLIFGSITFLNATNLTIIHPNNYYTKSNLNKAYIKLLSYKETQELINVINSLLKNSKFKQQIYFEEMGKVKVGISDILIYLKYFLAGWPKYSNTYFENNSNLAGIKKILKDSIDNDSNFINLPQNVIYDMKKSISNLKFFEIAKIIEYDVSHKNLKDSKNLIDIIKNLNMLISSYVNNLSEINDLLLKNYNAQIKKELEQNYRIYTKTSLIKIMQIFKSLINENYKAITNGL